MISFEIEDDDNKDKNELEHDSVIRYNYSIILYFKGLQR